LELAAEGKITGANDAFVDKILKEKSILELYIVQAEKISASAITYSQFQTNINSLATSESLGTLSLPSTSAPSKKKPLLPAPSQLFTPQGMETPYNGSPTPTSQTKEVRPSKGQRQEIERKLSQERRERERKDREERERRDREDREKREKDREEKERKDRERKERERKDRERKEKERKDRERKEKIKEDAFEDYEDYEDYGDYGDYGEKKNDTKAVAGVGKTDMGFGLSSMLESMVKVGNTVRDKFDIESEDEIELIDDIEPNDLEREEEELAKIKNRLESEFTSKKYAETKKKEQELSSLEQKDALLDVEISDLKHRLEEIDLRIRQEKDRYQEVPRVTADDARMKETITKLDNEIERYKFACSKLLEDWGKNLGATGDVQVSDMNYKKPEEPYRAPPNKTIQPPKTGSLYLDRFNSRLNAAPTRTIIHVSDLAFQPRGSSSGVLSSRRFESSLRPQLLAAPTTLTSPYDLGSRLNSLTSGGGRLKVVGDISVPTNARISSLKAQNYLR